MLKDLRPKIPVTRRVSAGLPVGHIPDKGGAATKAPSKLDFFRITKDAKDDAFSLDTEAHALLGPKPRRIPIRLLSDAVEDNLQISRQVWVGAFMACDGDGKVAQRRFYGERKFHSIPCHSDVEEWADQPPERIMEFKRNVAVELGKDTALAPDKTPKTRGLLKMLEMDKPDEPHRCIFAQNGDCKVVSQLVFKIEGLPGFARYRSHGIHTARELLTSFQIITADTENVLRNMPLVMVLKWQRITIPGGQTTSAPIIHVEAAEPDSTKLKALAHAELAQRKSLTTQMAEDRKLLAAAHAEIDVLGVAREFSTGDEPLEALIEEASKQESPSGSFGGGA